MLISAFTLDIVGKVMVAYTALAVHHRVAREHTIDREVFRVMKVEQYVGAIGIMCMIAAYVLHVYSAI
ncbi:hypothetical protein A3C89_01900 [Candidatus Kaiserbacteria bacterium RIFCSPHIGHO2_02_FULL_50_50]|uniref:Uncharacterized protein n=1 Tax=Candidatus Kaiserbacteria bacterium RIFCSPHIGHO2_02_FULL_50_50 TaxID=1798492 RepID=A0A1F6DCS5_9BACT|nr:MAG: hypothetical protein A3C89_01900 [Candidatus Kaiserbacteria bacterium RIFCSPHIGHO2_02_FULL_50_50]